MLLTITVYPMTSPISAEERSEFLITVIVGVTPATGTVLAALPADVGVAPPPRVVAIFWIIAGAFGAMLTATSTGGKLAPGARTSVRVHWNPVIVQFQPLPLMPVGIRPTAIGSVTVTVPVVGPVPSFVT